jgi:hypothetical protein
VLTFFSEWGDEEEAGRGEEKHEKEEEEEETKYTKREEN